MVLRWTSVIVCLAVLGGVARGEGVDMPRPAVSAEDVQRAIQSYIDTLWQTKDAKIYWELDLEGLEADRRTREKRYWGGRTALAVLAMLYGGEDPASDRIQEVLKWLAEIEMEATYITGIRSSVWSKLNKPEYKLLLARDAKTLMDSTLRSGQPSGWFGYMPGTGGDHSNTQYGVLGLRDAAIRGVEIPRIYWEAIHQHMIDTQAPNGGWGYPVSRAAQNETAYGSMTVACLANMYITLDRLSQGYEGPFNGYEARACGYLKEPAAITKGLEWLDRNLGVDLGLAQGGDVQTFRQHGTNPYYLYGLERCANASGRKTFGGLNWFQEGAKWILSRGRGREVCSVSWCALFLSKGVAPVFYNKLDYGPGWNCDILDIPNLSTYCGDELEQRINWQVVDIDDKVEEWLDAPVLFMNGHTMPALTDEQKKKLRDYTDSGGTILAEACCSKQEFVRGFKKLAGEVWPEWELQVLDKNHPLRKAHHEIRGSLPTVFHLNDGCRSRVFLVTQDMSCAWQQNIRDRYQAYFQFGLNVPRYATDKATMRTRLYWIPPPVEELEIVGKPAPVRPWEEQSATLGEWPTDGRRLTDVRGLRHLAETLDAAANVQLKTTVFSDHQLEKLDEVMVLHMSGHNTFSASEENLAKLRAFVKGGGLIWADPQCGREGFKESFEGFLKKLLPGAELKDVGADDPLITGQGLTPSGFDVSRVRYKEALKFNEFRPRLKEVRQDGRRVVVYSPCDLTCGLDGHDCWQCVGPVRNDALKMATNIVLSAMGSAAARRRVTTEDEPSSEESPVQELPRPKM